MGGQDGWRSHRLVSCRARYLRFRYTLFFYASIRILFETFFGVEGVESSPRSCATEFRHLGWAPLFFHNPVSQVGTYSRSAVSCKCSCRHTTPLQVCGSSGSTVITPAFITPPNTPRGCSDVLSPPFLSPPSFITPPNTPCGYSDVLLHPLVYHTPLTPPASCTLSPRVHKISHPPQDTTPGDYIFESQNTITGVCYLV